MYILNYASNLNNMSYLADFIYKNDFWLYCFLGDSFYWLCYSTAPQTNCLNIYNYFYASKKIGYRGVLGEFKPLFSKSLIKWIHLSHPQSLLEVVYTYFYKNFKGSKFLWLPSLLLHKGLNLCLQGLVWFGDRLHIGVTFLRKEQLKDFLYICKVFNLEYDIYSDRPSFRREFLQLFDKKRHFLA